MNGTGKCLVWWVDRLTDGPRTAGWRELRMDGVELRWLKRYSGDTRHSILKD